MTLKEAQEVLLLYRPGTADGQDETVQRAMELAQQDPELNRWFEEHCAFQNAMRAKFREIEAPSHFKAALLRRREEEPVPLRAWWQQPAWLAAAAALVVLLGLAAVWLRPAAPDRFADFREMMVGKAERGYAMEWKTSDLSELRSRMASKGAPSKYELTQAMEKLQVTGGASFTWRGNPVAMVCFERDKKPMWLFLLKSSALKDPPPARPESTQVSALITASWTQGQDTYLLAAAESAGFGAYLPR